MFCDIFRHVYQFFGTLWSSSWTFATPTQPLWCFLEGLNFVTKWFEPLQLDVCGPWCMWSGMSGNAHGCVMLYVFFEIIQQSCKQVQKLWKC